MHTEENVTVIQTERVGQDAEFEVRIEHRKRWKSEEKEPTQLLDPDESRMTSPHPAGMNNDTNEFVDV